MFFFFFPPAKEIVINKNEGIPHKLTVRYLEKKSKACRTTKVIFFPLEGKIEKTSLSF